MPDLVTGTLLKNVSNYFHHSFFFLPSRRSVLETAAAATNIPQGQQDPNGLNYPQQQQHPGQPPQRERDLAAQMVYPIVVTHLGADDITFSRRSDRTPVPLEGELDNLVILLF